MMPAGVLLKTLRCICRNTLAYNCIQCYLSHCVVRFITSVSDKHRVSVSTAAPATTRAKDNETHLFLLLNTMSDE